MWNSYLQATMLYDTRYRGTDVVYIFYNKSLKELKDKKHGILFSLRKGDRTFTVHGKNLTTTQLVLKKNELIQGFQKDESLQVNVSDKTVEDMKKDCPEIDWNTPTNINITSYTNGNMNVHLLKPSEISGLVQLMLTRDDDYDKQKLVVDKYAAFARAIHE